MFAKIFTTKVNTENYENENIEGENYEVTVYTSITAVNNRSVQIFLAHLVHML